MALAKAAPDPSSDQRIRVLFCCNPEFYQHLAVALVSMLENNPHAQFDVHLMTSGRDEGLEQKLRRSIAAYCHVVLTVHHLSLDSYAHFFVSSHISLESYLRIFAADVLGKEIGKVLYLDCDLVVTGDLMELWNTDIDAYALAAAPDLYGGFRRAALGIPANRTYVNAGVLLLNLARWRRDQLSESLIRFIEARAGSLTFHDQDAVNAVLQDSILLLDRRWNVQAQMFRLRRHVFPSAYAAIRDACRRPAIVHYAGPEKPWRFRVSVAKRRLYFQYLRKTEWRDARLQGAAWYHRPECWLGGALSRIGIDYMRIIVLARKCCGRLGSLVARGRRGRPAGGAERRLPGRTALER
jgi:lipopolysaccharide biosynthesis glycosyltransferase